MNNNSTPSVEDRVRASLKKRYAREKRFQYYGIGAILISLLFLCVLFGDIISKGYTAFQQTYVKLDIYF
ncbi:MAG TPA: phosphate ABC transporter, permease protein PstA, partial [Gammaproteobacteria bacterium]|nr:phosphate ABC transporter, permease protein PstA [Gammaproteobacteria bacterium]